MKARPSPRWPLALAGLSLAGGFASPAWAQRELTRGRTPAVPGSQLPLAVPGSQAAGAAARTPEALPTGPPPTGLHVAARTPVEITLGWTAAPGASGYLVDRQGKGVLTPSPLPPTATRYTDRGAFDHRVSHRYTVTATYADGRAAASASVQAVAATPVSPSSLTARVGGREVTLTWTPVAGASFYLVTGPGLPLDPKLNAVMVRPPASSLVARDVPWGQHKWSVSAVWEAEGGGWVSDRDARWATVPVLPEAPRFTAVRPWQEATGRAGLDFEFAGGDGARSYTLSRAEPGQSPIDVSADRYATTIDVQRKTGRHQNDVGGQRLGPVPGKTYDYRLCAVFDGVQVSPCSGPTRVHHPAAAVFTFRARSLGSGRVELTWAPPPGTFFKDVDVVRGGFGWFRDIPAADTRFEERGVPQGTWHYRAYATTVDDLRMEAEAQVTVAP